MHQEQPTQLRHNADSAQNEADSRDGFALSRQEQGQVRKKQPPRAAVLHETIRLQGEQELSRAIPALAWSSLAAGLSMGFSMLACGLLRHYLSGVPGAFLIESLGYPFGFLVVILARQQLFTENTMTAVLPLMTHPGGRKLASLLRLWLVVFAGNVAGTAVFAFGLLHMQLFDASMQSSLAAIGQEVMRNTPLQMFTKGVVAGWLIATMVWLVPAADHAKITVIVLTTYLIALGGFTHIIAGSAEVLYLLFAGRLDLAGYVLGFAVPTLAGNIIGGSCIFALISHAQVRGDQAEDQQPGRP